MKSQDISFEKYLNEIIEEIRSYYPGFNKTQEKKIEKAFWFGFKAHENQKRFSGEPYFVHPVKATKILLSIKPDIETVIACLLHDVIEDTDVTAREIEKNFDKNVSFLCESLSKISKVRLKTNEQIQKYENLQKLFIAIAKDIRVIFIKLADRIHNLKTLEYVRKEKRERIARESFEIYSPVAKKLGLFEFKTEINDLYLKNLYPEIYDSIEKDIIATKKERELIINKAKDDILKIFDQECFEILEIQGRQKNLYSVYEKMKRKNLGTVFEIYDLFGIRILVRNLEDCYRALGLLHSYWTPMQDRFKDYISVPKPNGYQSLHTTVLGLGKSNIPTEIQIRTKQMHMDAEFGPAAHWAYKRTKHSNFDEDYVKKTSWFPENIPFDSPNNPEEFFEKIANAILEERIYVFTPKGEIKILTYDATPVDFAYAIHTEIGDSCIGARVNGMIKPLDYKLKNGEVIEIMTKKGRHPNPLWIKFVKSSIARNSIQSFINKQKLELESELLKNKKITKDILKTRFPKEEKNKKVNIKTSKSPSGIIIGGEKNLPCRLSKCCDPTPGVDIIAYKSRGLEFKIHRTNCSQLKKLSPERFVEAYFRLEKTFSIKAYDRIGLLRDYTKIIAEYGLNITNAEFVFEKGPTEKISIWTFSIEYSSPKEFFGLVEDIKKIQNVFLVEEK